jgi:hypothetical protein
MQQVQLYIGDQRIELFKDETISLTNSIQNVKDVAKVFTDFTKTFSIPATKSNNKVFKHYYNFDIVGGFDARLKTVGSIKLNGVDFKKGKIKLEGVDLKDNKPNAYRVTFFGDLVDLKDLIGDDLLSDLDWLDNFQKEYSTANVKDNLKGNNTTVSFVNSSGLTEIYPNAIKTALISTSERLFYRGGFSSGADGNLWYQSGTGESHQNGVYWKDLKYSIAVYVIVKAIEVKYNITFSSDFFHYSTAEYSSLMMLMHRKKGYAKASYSTGVQLYQVPVVDFNQIGPVWEATQDGNNYTVAGTYNGFTTSGQFGAATGVYYSYLVTLDAQDNNIPYNAYLYYTSDATGVKTLIDEIQGAEDPVYFGDLTLINKAAVGEYSIVVEAAESLTFLTGNISVESRMVYQSTSIGSGAEKGTLIDTDIEEKFAWLPTQQLPKMKVLDFLTGLWKIWNLTAYVESDGTIKVQKLDDFYLGATSYDVTKFVDVNTSQVNIALPYKQINFKFKGRKTFLAATFEQLNNREFATLEYKGENPDNWVGNEYKVELPFEKMVYERLSDENTLLALPIMYGFFADDNQEPYIGEPLLHYATLQNPTSISFRDSTVTHSEITTSIFMPSNQVVFATNTSQNTINFYPEINEWTASVNYNSLFEENYKEYIQDVFNEKRRITKVKAFLPLRILLKYTLADTFIISGKEYKINSITTNLQTGESDMELLNVV